MADNKSREANTLGKAFEAVGNNAESAGREIAKGLSSFGKFAEDSPDIEYIGDKPKPNELTFKIDVDVSEALTGLKALQREAREATKALKELEAESGKIAKVNELRDLQGLPGNYDVSDYMTGLFNGLELASATLENREPEYKPCRPDDAFATKSITDDIRRCYEMGGVRE